MAMSPSNKRSQHNQQVDWDALIYNREPKFSYKDDAARPNWLSDLMETKPKKPGNDEQNWFIY